MVDHRADAESELSWPCRLFPSKPVLSSAFILTVLCLIGLVWDFEGSLGMGTYGLPSLVSTEANKRIEGPILGIFAGLPSFGPVVYDGGTWV